MKKLVVINLGSTSTKIAYFEDAKIVFSASLSHPAEEIQAFLQKTVYSHSQRVVEQPVLPEEGPDFDVFESAMQETKAPPADDTERSEP